MTRKGPVPAEHREIARGSGPAAILMFLQIAATGYLAFTTLYLLRYRLEAAWALTHIPAALFYWFPAFFAALGHLPTDPLTHKVGRVAQIAGVIALIVQLICVVALYATGHLQGATPWYIALSAVVLGLSAGVATRVIFGSLTASARRKYEKNAFENELPE